MSLLNSGPDTVQVIPVSPVKNRYGSYDYVRQAPITIKGLSVEPYGSQSYRGLETMGGEAVNDVILIRAGADNLKSQGFDTWPGGSHSILVWNGREYDQEGLAKSFRRGSSTKHDKIRARLRGTTVR